MRWGDDLGLSRWVQCNHRGPYKETREGDGMMEAEVRQGGRERMRILENVMLLALKMNKEVVSQRMQEPCSFWKAQGNGFPS